METSLKSREDLHNLNFDIVESVKKRVHDLNEDLYEECLSIKNKKSDDLLLPSVTHNQDYKKLVVTIPENLHLSDIERKVLSKGLSFIPTSAKNNRNKTNVDLQRFYRRVKLHAYFNDPDKPISENSDVTKEYSVFNKYKKAASSWTPTDVHPSISRFILRCNEDISRIHRRKHHSNFTKEEHQALDHLKNNEDILIKKADKGGAVVVWKKDLYIAEGERQLNDVESYQVLDSDNTNENNRIVEEFIKAEIDQDRLPPEAKVLIQRKPRCSIFYMLPKIHKVGNLGRPIVSTCNCPTELISSYVDDVLQPIVSQLPSFCKDSTDAL